MVYTQLTVKTNKQFGLIIGRFQPPCLHHLEFIKEVIHSGITEILIGIGDAGIIDDKNFQSFRNRLNNEDFFSHN